MTEAEIIVIINSVAKNYTARKFGVFNYDDLFQHARTFCVAKMHLFDYSKHRDGKDISKALESWLNRIVSNQMKNLYRDNVKKAYKTYQKDTCDADKHRRASVLNPEHIGLAFFPNLFGSYEDKCGMDMLAAIKSIAKHLDDEEFEILAAVLNDESVPSNFKKRMIEKCQMNLAK